MRLRLRPLDIHREPAGVGPATTGLDLPRRLTLLVVRLYQNTVSPMYGPTCRFYPSCSSYAGEAVLRHGLCRGVWLTLRRLSRCHPWNPGGIDLVPTDPSRGA